MDDPPLSRGWDVPLDLLVPPMRPEDEVYPAVDEAEGKLSGGGDEGREEESNKKEGSKVKNSVSGERSLV